MYYVCQKNETFSWTLILQIYLAHKNNLPKKLYKKTKHLWRLRKKTRVLIKVRFFSFFKSVPQYSWADHRFRINLIKPGKPQPVIITADHLASIILRAATVERKWSENLSDQFRMTSSRSQLIWEALKANVQVKRRVVDLSDQLRRTSSCSQMIWEALKANVQMKRRVVDL